MAHEIDMSNNRANYAHAGRKAWHGLGVAVPGLMTVLEALVAAGMDWTVEKRPIYALEGGDGSLPAIPVDGHYATIRTDTNMSLGVVGERYEVVQNSDALSFFDPAIGEGAAAIDSVGSLCGGRRTFMLAKIPEVVEVVPGDGIERYLLFTNSFDGSSAVEVLFTPVRVVCQNTLSAALKGESRRVKIRHTASCRDKLEAAHLVLDNEREYFKRIRGAYAYMAKRDVNREEVAKFVCDLFPGRVDPKTKTVKTATKTRKRRQAVVRAFEDSPGSDLAGTTGWGLFNAATYFIDHDRSLPEKTDAWEASVIGSGVALRQKAFDLALAL